MTISEYLNQKDHVYMPYVVLKKGDYKIGYKKEDRTTIPHEIHQKVFVNGLDAEYCLINGRGALHTVDRDGNPVDVSCYHILD